MGYDKSRCTLSKFKCSETCVSICLFGRILCREYAIVLTVTLSLYCPKDNTHADFYLFFMLPVQHHPEVENKTPEVKAQAAIVPVDALPLMYQPVI